MTVGKGFTWWGYSHGLALVVLGLIQDLDIKKRSVSLSETNFAMAGYLLCIDLIFA